jgi:beta-lactamase class A
MMEVFHQAQQGRFSLDDALPIKNEFHSIVDHSVFSLSIGDDSETNLYTFLGKVMPIRDIVVRMITHSSNLATNLLMERVTARKVTSFMHKLGAEGLLIRRGVEDNKAFARGLNNAATAQGLMQILIRLAAHQVVSQVASEEMIAIMKQQHHNEGIPSSLPAEVSVAHKTGWNGQLYHDAAIIYPRSHDPYVLVVMTRGLSDQKEAPSLVASISRIIYDRQSDWR